MCAPGHKTTVRLQKGKCEAGLNMAECHTYAAKRGTRFLQMDSAHYKFGCLESLRVVYYNRRYPTTGLLGSAVCKGGCETCPRNTFSTSKYSMECKKCPHYKPVTSGPGSQYCDECPVGYGFDEKVKQCSPCFPGYYSYRSHCEMCKNGFVVKDSIGNRIGCTPKCMDGYEWAIARHEKLCQICRTNFFSTNGEPCQPCPKGFTNEDSETRASCPQVDKDLDIKLQKLSHDQNEIFQLLDKQKEKQEDIVSKNSRLWQKDQIREHYNSMMRRNKAKNLVGKREEEACALEKQSTSVIFSAVELSDEIELHEDTTCIDANRDRMLKAFCSFRKELETYHELAFKGKKLTNFWPNICCKERSGDTLEPCEASLSAEMVPFARSQGGNFNFDNLYTEVSDTLKRGGYIHSGLMKLLNSLPNVNAGKKIAASKFVTAFFADLNMCGPRMIDAPGEPDTKLCQLFVPYKRSFNQFLQMVKSMYVWTSAKKQPTSQKSTAILSPRRARPTTISRRTPSVPQRARPKTISRRTPSVPHGVNRPLRNASSLLDVQDHLFVERRLRQTNSNSERFADIMKNKLKKEGAAKETRCKAYFTKPLREWKDAFCPIPRHLDFNDAQIRTIAVHYHSAFHLADFEMLSLAQKLRFKVEDKSCPTPLFAGNDISIQQISIPSKADKEWAAVVSLNTDAKDGYIQSEAKHCRDKDYLAGAEVDVQLYIDSDACCESSNDWHDCKGICKDSKGSRKDGTLEPMKDAHGKPYVVKVDVRGSRYVVNDKSSFRRKLLQRRYGSC